MKFDNSIEINEEAVRCGWMRLKMEKVLYNKIKQQIQALKGVSFQNFRGREKCCCLILKVT